jgi:hypothetical protein
VLPAARVAFVESWLSLVCRPDPRFANNDVSTVYYDTPGQQSVREKIDSDYLKMKLRVRWYAAPGAAPAGDAFVELKRRVGDRRDKVRVVLPGAAADLAGRRIEDPIWADLPRELLKEGIRLEAVWRPTLALVYRRTRFVDPTSAARISCDSHIRPTAVHRSSLAAWPPGPLPEAVIEIKGPSDELPAPLRPIVRFGARLSSFSKYVAVWEHVRRRTA